MGIKIDKYLDLENRYAIYGEKGYFINPFIIHKILVDELNLAVSYNEIVEFVNNSSITITKDEIKDFLNKKFEEENPELKKRIEAPRTKSGGIELGKESIDSAISFTQRFTDELSVGRYYFEPYSLKYFKTYISILKEKCKTLFSVLTDLEKIKTGEISEEAKQRFSGLDFHISNGDIYFKDAERLVNAIVYNINDLREKLKAGNNPETYLTFKLSEHCLMKEDIWPSEIYPSKEIQIRDEINGCLPEFIELSEAQKKQIREEQIESCLRWLEWDFATDDDIDEKGPLVKNKSNKKQ